MAGYQKYSGFILCASAVAALAMGVSSCEKTTPKDLLLGSWVFQGDSTTEVIAFQRDGKFLKRSGGKMVSPDEMLKERSLIMRYDFRTDTLPNRLDYVIYQTHGEARREISRISGIAKFQGKDTLLYATNKGALYQVVPDGFTKENTTVMVRMKNH